jgi:hypothetical protein
MELSGELIALTNGPAPCFEWSGGSKDLVNSPLQDNAIPSSVDPIARIKTVLWAW